MKKENFFFPSELIKKAVNKPGVTFDIAVLARIQMKVSQNFHKGKKVPHQKVLNVQHKKYRS